MDCQLPVLRRLHQEVHRPALPGGARRRPTDGTVRPGKFLVACDIYITEVDENPMFKPVLSTAVRAAPSSRRGPSATGSARPEWVDGTSSWGTIDPALGCTDHEAAPARPSRSSCPVSTARRQGRPRARGVPVRRIDERLVTTVSTSCSRSTAWARPDLPGSGRVGTTTPPRPTRRPGRSRSPVFPRRRSPHRPGVGAERDRHRGPGDDHPRCRNQPLVPLRHDLPRILLLTTITGTQGVNGGGWAHYVGQEKTRPIMGPAGLRPGLGATAEADDPDRLLVPAH